MIRSITTSLLLLLGTFTHAALAQQDLSLASRKLLSAAAEGDSVGIAAALAEGANANATNAKNIPALLIAVNSGKADAVKALLTAGAGGINDSYDLGKAKTRPLALAAWSGYNEVAAVLLASGADLKADNGDAWRGAVVSASLPTIQVFLTAGADPNFRFADGESAVTISSLRGNVDALKLLLDNHGNGNFRNNRGVTAIMYAAARGHEAAVELLLERKVALYPLGVEREFAYGAAQQNKDAESRKRISDLLVKHGAPKELRNRDIDDQLLKAAYAGDVTKAKALLDQGADVEVRGVPNATLWLRDALSASVKSPAVCRLLLDRGANVFARDGADFTALHTAASDGNPQCVRLLIEHGADPNAKSSHGDTPLYQAVNAMRAANAAALLDGRADVSVEGEMLIRMAKENGMTTTARLLEEALTKARSK